MGRKPQSQPRPSGTEELDLHGLTRAEALRLFVRVYNQCAAAGNVPLRVIHGYGSAGGAGVLARELRRFFAAHRDALEFIPGEDFFCNPGETLVYPKKKLSAR